MVILPFFARRTHPVVLRLFRISNNARYNVSRGMKAIDRIYP